jgi:uncharacterized repeat protein (TIGR01451 family)
MTAATTTESFAAAGDVIDYQYTVTNTGTTTLSGIAVGDSTINPVGFDASGPATPVTVDCPNPTLAPGAHEVCTSTYTVTQSDVDSGQNTDTPPTGTDPAGTPWVQNLASPLATPTTAGDGATAQNPGGATVVQTNTPQTVYVYGTGANVSCSQADPQTCISVSESSTSTFTASGQTIDYTITVTNTGTISLSNVSASSTLVPTPTCELSPSAFLAPGDSETCSGSYVTTPTDVSNGQVTDTPSATGFDVDFGNQYSANGAAFTINYTGGI